jgi:hypothetical protein
VNINGVFKSPSSNIGEEDLGGGMSRQALLLVVNETKKASLVRLALVFP